MSSTVLRIKGLGKAFRVERQPRSTRITEELVEGWRRLTRRAPPPELFWALQGVSFEVQQGEVVGVIGRNGAGKSTLLKLLSQILHPTAGRIEIDGRIGSLLEVGTGFHPELTGRENVFLNGAILGMSRREVSQKFDAIVDFSEIERFLDMPVKHYSSGMALRLAFAVAAHLEPEILIIDEVLAVGDLPFQKKCLGRLRSLTESSGRTVLLVSHNPAALASLCSRGIVLEAGQVVVDGGIHEALQYSSSVAGSVAPEWNGASGDEFAKLVRAWVRPPTASTLWDTGEPLEVGATIEVLQPLEGLIFGFRLLSEYGAELAYTLYDDAEVGHALPTLPSRITQTWVIPGQTLAAGRYRIAFEVALAYRKVCHRSDTGELEFDLENLTGLGRRYPVQGVRGFCSLLRPNWIAERRVETVPDA